MASLVQRLSLYALLSTRVTSVGTKLSALNHSAHALYLYRELRSDGAPSETEFTSPPGRFYRRICKDIFDSGFFRGRRSFLVDVSEGLWGTFYGYEQRELDVAEYRFKEYVFICPYRSVLMLSSIMKIRPFYVSKEYNVSPFGTELYMPGRFIIGRLPPLDDNYVILAEEPAKPYTEPEFDVEHYYLLVRNYTEPAKSNQIDPLCKLASGHRHDPHNQHYRLCVAALRSSHFKDTVRYPILTQYYSYSCEEKKVSFRTAGAQEEAAGKSFIERMTLCHSLHEDLDEGESYLYLSRAYKSGEVFVYRHNRRTGRTYLENLSTNMKVVDELNSFDFVEP